MKKIKLAVLGYGNRGQVYADYSLDEPDEVEVVAVIDPNEYKLKVAKERYKLSAEQLFMLPELSTINQSMGQSRLQAAVRFLLKVFIWMIKSVLESI